jgi:hypothetical protein
LWLLASPKGFALTSLKQLRDRLGRRRASSMIRKKPAPAKAGMEAGFSE